MAAIRNDDQETIADLKRQAALIFNDMQFKWDILEQVLLLTTYQVL